MSLRPLSPVAPPSAWQMYRSLCGVGLLCGLLIVSVYELTSPIIRQNRIDARQQAIFEVIPGARTTGAYRLEGDRFSSASASDDGGGLVFAGYGEDGELLGVAVEATGMGYQDTIRILYGYSIRDQAIIGMQVLESRETPGLGDRIEVDPDFRRNFEHLDVSLDPSGEHLLHPIEAAKAGGKEHPWQIDCISGATISSQAVAAMLRSSAMAWIPLIHLHEDEFRSRQ